ncbi:uncharacterized protein LOC134675340 [Cydia fagiglandana]|uniref:uncharacterized protein LOC134675340 n=1 Tax=Cydia fagiglandana TaxID=1458189 RepID=UPI002FEE45B1
MGTDIEYLRKHDRVETKSNLLKLNPYIDENNILRAKGRLNEANIPYEMKFPKIIPKHARLTTLLIEQAHLLTFHGGARLTMAKLKEQYWVMGGMNTVKKQLGKCVRCKKIEGKKQQQIMSALPAARVNEAKPFYHTGVDYTGYVDIKASKGRGIKTLKGYIAIFVCMVTKAVHLELVTELTSSAFLAALRRMAARKGTPRHMYSDNGTNFVGSNNILQEQWQDLRNIFNNSFLSEITEMEIEWHFNAPSWPSAGGLWERAVRSLKHHLKRVIGEQKLTYEEYSTILAQLEACLNSRPLCPLTEDIEDLDFLTPAHFLTGRAGLTVIETEEDARTRWHLTQKIVKDIWKKWKFEYLSQLSARPKWNTPQKNLEIDDMVVIHDDNLPAGKWALGRVVNTHAGPDGYVRVVTLKTKNGLLKRPVIKLSLLPIPKDTEQQDKQESQPKQQTNKQKPNKKLGCATTIFMTLMYLMSLLTLGSCVQVTHVNKTQGLYFDNIGNMLLVKDEWKLVAYQDLNPYWEGITAYKKYNTQLENICKQVKTLTHCDIVILQLRHSYDELQHYNRILSSQQLKPETRRRRGLVNGVGNLANTLFGVLDDRFAEQYQKDIGLIKNNEKHLVNLWKNQTSVMEAEYNMLLRNKDTIQKQHKLIHAHLISLDQGTSALQKEVSAAECMAQFNMIAMAANNLLNHLTVIQNDLLDTLTNIYNGKMNIHIIDPKQFQRELNIISGQLVSDLSLPIDNIQTNLQDIYHLLNIKAKMTDQYMIIEIRIPLVSRVSYDLYNIIPIQHSTGRNMISIIPIEKYIAINLRKDAYLPITEKEIEQCITRDVTTTMCYLKTPVFKMNSDKDLCIKNENYQCKINTAACQNKWISLSKVNQYLYFCCDACHLRTLCKSQVTSQTVSQTNIINVDEDCVVKTDNFTIHTHQNMQSQVNVKLNILTPEIDPINHIINITLSDYENSTSDSSYNEEELKDLGNKINTMKQNQPLLDNYSSNDIHHYTAIYCLWGVVIIGIIIYASRKMRGHWKVKVAPPSIITEPQGAADPVRVAGQGQAQEPSPAPRTRSPRGRRGLTRHCSVSDSDKCSANVKKVEKCDKLENIELKQVDRSCSPVFRQTSFRN